MAIFNSQKINVGPRPWRNPYDGSRWRDNGGWAEMIYDPRTEFDNKPNPILVGLRNRVDVHGKARTVSLAKSALATLSGSAHQYAHIDHARKVLQRLASLCTEVV